MKSIKQTLTQPKAVHEILDQLTEEGELQYKRTTSSLLLSALSAGLEIGFSVLLMCVMFTLYHRQVGSSAMHMLISISYPLGFLFVILGKSELFTEHTTVAVLPAFGKKTTFFRLLRLWGLLLVGNLTGVLIFSLMLITLPVSMEIIDPAAFEHLALHTVGYHWYNILGSAIFAGWLMGLLGWLITSSTDTISRIFIIILVTFVIGVAGLHHSIVGAAEMLTGAFTSSKVGMKDVFFFLTLAVPGNIIGGAVFVAALKKSHTRKEHFEAAK